MSACSWQHIVERVGGNFQNSPYFGEHPPVRHQSESTSCPTIQLAFMMILLKLLPEKKKYAIDSAGQHRLGKHLDCFGPSCRPPSLSCHSPRYFPSPVPSVCTPPPPHWLPDWGWGHSSFDHPQVHHKFLVFSLQHFESEGGCSRSKWRSCPPQFCSVLSFPPVRHNITGKSSGLRAVVIACGVGQEEESEDGSLGCPGCYWWLSNLLFLPFSVTELKIIWCS